MSTQVYRWVKGKECPPNYDHLHWREVESKCKVTIFPYEHFVLVTDADGAHDTYALDWNKIEYLEEINTQVKETPEQILQKLVPVSIYNGAHMYNEQTVLAAINMAYQLPSIHNESTKENHTIPKKP